MEFFMANEMNDNLNDIEKEIALSRREKELEPFKILFEIDLKGNVEPEAWDLYNKCLNLEISMALCVKLVCDISSIFVSYFTFLNVTAFFSFFSKRGCGGKKLFFLFKPLLN